MTVYRVPDFEAEALDLDHVPEGYELYPDDLTRNAGPQDGEVRLAGSWRKYKAGVEFGEQEDGNVTIAIWTASDAANANLALQYENGGEIQIKCGALDIRAAITDSNHDTPATVDELFFKPPDTWGMRGDTYLWADIRDMLSDTPLPGSADKLEQLIRSAFRDLTEHDIDHSRPVFIERYDTGGMSSGLVDPRAWRENHLPLLRERFEYAKGWKKPTCPRCGSKDSVRIEYGEPSMEMFEAAERGEIRLGGCCVTENDPEWHCWQCERQW